MSGKNVGIVGSRRGFLLTDEIAVRQVAKLVDSAPTHSGCAGNERNVTAANRFPYTLRANAKGTPCLLALTTINGVPQAVLVENPSPRWCWRTCCCCREGGPKRRRRWSARTSCLTSSTNGFGRTPCCNRSGCSVRDTWSPTSWKRDRHGSSTAIPCRRSRCAP